LCNIASNDCAENKLFLRPFEWRKITSLDQLWNVRRLAWLNGSIANYQDVLRKFCTGLKTIIYTTSFHLRLYSKCNSSRWFLAQPSVRQIFSQFCWSIWSWNLKKKPHIAVRRDKDETEARICLQQIDYRKHGIQNKKQSNLLTLEICKNLVSWISRSSVKAYDFHCEKIRLVLIHASITNSKQFQRCSCFPLTTTYAYHTSWTSVS